MSRVIALVIGLYTGVAVDQNFQVPKAPVPQALLDWIRQQIGEDKKKK